jgi:hypothetical protein
MTSYDLTLGHDVLERWLRPLRNVTWHLATNWRPVTASAVTLHDDASLHDTMILETYVFDIIVTRRNPQSYVTIHSGVTLVHMHTKLRWVFFFMWYVRYFPQSQIQTKKLYPFLEFSVLDFEIHNKLWIYHRSKFVYINNIFFTLLS